MVKKNYDNMLSRFYLIPEGHRQTDGETDIQTDRRTDRIVISISRISVLTRDKKRNVYAVRVTFHPCAVLTCLNSYTVTEKGGKIPPWGGM